MIEPIQEIPLPPPSHVERALMWIPLIGWLISHALHVRRHRPQLKIIHAQLARRPRIGDEDWGPDLRRVDAARVVRAAIGRECNWANNRLIPEDRLRLAIWPCLMYAEPEFLFILADISSTLKLDRPTSEDWSRLGDATVGGFVDMVLDLVSRRAGKEIASGG